MNYKVSIKRIYEKKSDDDGFGIICDRIWPRGISKEQTKDYVWEKEIAPSSHIRKEFAHDPAKFPKFQEDYIKELNSNPKRNDFIKLVQEHIAYENVTLFYSAKNTEFNNAVVLCEWIKRKLEN